MSDDPRHEVLTRALLDYVSEDADESAAEICATAMRAALAALDAMPKPETLGWAVLTSGVAIGAVYTNPTYPRQHAAESKYRRVVRLVADGE